jgi:hypothetical protein
MWIEHYNKETKTLTIPYNFNEELKDIPEETEIIIFNKNSNFNQPVNNLPKTITHLSFGRQTPVRLAHPKIMNIFIILEMSLF